MNKIKTQYLRLPLDRPYLTLFLSFIVVFFLAIGISWIKIDDDFVKMFPDDIKSKVVWDQVQKEFGSTEHLVVAFGYKDKNLLNDEKAYKNLSSLVKEFDIIETSNRIHQSSIKVNKQVVVFEDDERVGTTYEWGGEKFASGENSIQKYPVYSTDTQNRNKTNLYYIVHSLNGEEYKYFVSRFNGEDEDYMILCDWSVFEPMISFELDTADKREVKLIFKNIICNVRFYSNICKADEDEQRRGPLNEEEVSDRNFLEEFDTLEIGGKKTKKRRKKSAKRKRKRKRKLSRRKK